jgi:hypothetical protein
MRVHSKWFAALLLLGFGCRSATTPAGFQQGGGDAGLTGLEGVVRRGPTQPVCRVGEPCDAPFSAQFAVEQGGRVVATFASDSVGHFLIYLAPGSYTVVPAASAPLMSPGLQAREVVVGPSGLTHVELDFDTGIR